MYENAQYCKETEWQAVCSDGNMSAVSLAAASQSWQLDKLANWTSFNNNGSTETRTHNATNEIVSSSLYGTTAHDDNGNMTFHDNKQFVWDTNNRLREVYSTSGNAAIAKYYYDAMNLRVRKDIDTDDDGLLDDTTLYYYCGQKVCEERDGNNNFKRDYVHGGQFIDEVIMTSDVAGAIGTFSLTDLRYSVYAVVDGSGTVLERYKYDPYGERTVMNAGFGVLSSSSVGQEFSYTGRRLDNETNLHYFRSRYYSGELGRFVSRDPIGYHDGMSLYQAYFAVNGVDPSGMLDDTVTPAVCSAITKVAWSCAINAWVFFTYWVCDDEEPEDDKDPCENVEAKAQDYHDAQRETAKLKKDHSMDLCEKWKKQLELAKRERDGRQSVMECHDSRGEGVGNHPQVIDELDTRISNITDKIRNLCKG